MEILSMSHPMAGVSTDEESPLPVNRSNPNDKVLCPHCLRTASNGIKCKGICVADSDYWGSGWIYSVYFSSRTRWNSLQISLRLKGSVQARFIWALANMMP
jgi:hypothetical protein